MTKANRLPWDELWMGVADLVAMRSDCDRRQVGAAIVDRTQRIIATGYNGPPAGTPFAGTGCVNYCERGGGDVHESYQNCPAIQLKPMLFYIRADTTVKTERSTYRRVYAWTALS